MTCSGSALTGFRAAKICEKACLVLAGGTAESTEMGRWREKNEARLTSVRNQYLVIAPLCSERTNQGN